MNRTPRPVPHAPRMRSSRIGVIGAGTMGQAILKGLLARGMPRRALIAADTDAATRRRVARRFGIAVSAEPRDVARRARIVLLAVKPQQLPGAVARIAPQMRPRQLVISIAAGITVRWLERRLPGAAVIRAMPNLPATVGAGFTAITAGQRARAADRRAARRLFEAVGAVAELPERHFDAITAVSGSGPAYLFYLVHAWGTAAQALGLPDQVAQEAIRTTLEGSLKLLEASGEPAEALVKKVASKGGTTEAALTVLQRGRVSERFVAALTAAARRSKELSCR